MTSDLAKRRNDTYVQRYDVDPYAAFASEGGPGIQGKRLTCKKGDWALGQDDTPVPPGTQFLLIVSEMMRGWLKWEAGKVTAADMGFVRDNYLVKHRYALGDLDEELWEKDPTGKSRDPWSLNYRTLAIEVSPPHGDVTLVGSSYGMEIACKEICGIYSAGRLHHPDAYPVIELATAPWMSKRYGKQIRPDFTVVGWATVEDIKAGRKVSPKPAEPKAKPKPKTKKAIANEPDHEAPADWGTAAA